MAAADGNCGCPEDAGCCPVSLVCLLPPNTLEAAGAADDNAASLLPPNTLLLLPPPPPELPVSRPDPLPLPLFNNCGCPEDAGCCPVSLVCLPPWACLLLVADSCDCLVPNTDGPILPPKTEAVVEDGCVVPGFVESPRRPPNMFEDPACGVKRCPEDGLLEPPPKTEAPDPAAATGKGAAWLSDDLEV